MATCKLVILDEVNIKFVNLDLDTRKALVKKFKYEDPTARFRPSYQLGRWDGAVSFFGLGGTSYLYMAPAVLEFLESRNYYIEIEDLRTSPALEFNSITEEYWGDTCWPSSHIAAGQPIRLRDYQVDIINKFLLNPQCLQAISTGAGKTIISATLAKICEKYGRTIIIVPSKSLVEQTEADYVNCGLDVGVYYGDRKELGRTHTICTWQSLSILDKKTKDNTAVLTLAEFLDGINTVMVDECHSVKAGILKTLLTHNLCNSPIRWGLTGTIPKDEIDQLNLKVALGELINEVKAADLQAQGVLSNCHVSIMQTAEWKEFGSYAEELKYLVTDVARIKFISDMIADISTSGNTLVLVNRIDSGKLIIENIPHAVFISGEVKTKDRKEEYDDIKTSTNKIIIATYGVAAVGLDIPRLFNVVLLEPGKSFVRVIQSIGRGLRKAGDKDHVEIYDITATTKYAKKHLTERKRFYKEANYAFTVNKITRAI